MFTVAVIIIYFPYGAEETTKQYFITLHLNVHSFNLANIWNINSDNLVWQLKQNESFKSPFVPRPNDLLHTNLSDLHSQMQLIYTIQLAEHQPLPSAHAILFADSSYHGEYCLIPMILIDTTMQTPNPPA